MMIRKRNRLVLHFLRISIVLLFLVFGSESLSQNLKCAEIELPREIPAINDLLIKNSKLYLATAQGLYVRTDTTFKRIFDPSAKESYRINTIATDRAGNLWFGTYSGLLVQFSGNSILSQMDLKPFSESDNYLISSISIDTTVKNKNTEILLSMSGGELFGYDTLTQNIKKYESPVPGTIFSFNYGIQPLKWLCTADGFYTLKRRMKWKKKADFFAVYQVIENNGKFWGIGRNKDNEAMLTLYYDDEYYQKHFTWKEFDLTQLGNKYAKFNELAFTDPEIAWIASDIGLLRYNPIFATLDEYSKVNGVNLKSLKHIAVESNHVIWVSSSGRKLVRIELE